MAIPIIFGILLGIAVPALADEAGGGGKGNKMNGWPVRWKATSPAIHKGDQHTLVVENTSEETQEARIRTVIMDHRNHTNTDVVDERVKLAPGEEREFTATNDYGTANHFNTIIGSETQDLALSVEVTDSEGAETARFNEKAFLAQEGKKAKGGGAKANGAKAHKHAHDEGFVASVPTALNETIRLWPVPLGVLTVAGIGLHEARRRWAWAGPASGKPAEPGALLPVWRAAAVGGLALSGVLHIGLAPVHFAEATVQGVSFSAAGAVAMILAAAIVAWPSRPAYLAGAGIALALIALWAVFLLVPPPGAGAAEGVDLVGLYAKATELVAAAGCAVLWFRAPRMQGSERAEP